jgi:hypothetical protein
MALSKEAARFLLWHTSLVVIGVLLCVSTIVMIDPYRLYGLVELTGFNRIKPQPERYREQIKVTGAIAANANVIIAGNSRAEIGFDPEYQGLNAAGWSTYNLALAGTATPTAQRELNDLRSHGVRPARLIIGVDFLDFLLDPAKSAPGTGPNQSLPSSDEFKWKFDALFSMESMVDAVKTVHLQRASEAEIMTPRGFNPLLEYKKHARNDGYYPLFQQRATEYAKTFVLKPHGLVEQATGSSANFSALRDILASSAREDTKLDVVIYPYHAQMLAMFEQVGLDPVFARWKSMLAHDVEAILNTYPHAKITLWDFSGFSPLQCETIPARGDKTAVTQWYWEAGHFKPALGNQMLSRILNGPGRPDDFGVSLTTLNLTQNQRRFENERAACMKTYPKLFSEAQTLVETARAKKQTVTR